MSPLIWRILTGLVATAAVASFALVAGPIARQAQQLSANYGVGFVLIVGLMTMLVLISIVRMPLSQAAVRRHHR